jgi:hypothetical protein
MSWHVDERTWQAYAAGTLPPATETAVETHVTTCPRCRVGARAVMPDPEPLWQAVHAEITAPRLPRALRALARLGVPEDDLVVLAAADDLLLSWSVAVGAAVVCALVTGLAPPLLPGGPQALFLVLAPLVPVLAVVATYDATDPFRELTEAAPFSTLRLALLRTAAALTAAIPLTVTVALVLPAVRGSFAAWLLPGLALTVATLILLTWLTAWVACAVSSAGWICAASAAAGVGIIDVVTTVAGQAGFVLAVVALTALLVRVGTVQHPRGVLR